MDLEQDAPFTEILLAKYFAQEASAEEATQVAVWLKESTENQLYYEDLQKTWKGIATHQQLIEVDTDAAWLQFKQNLATPAQKQADTLALKTFQKRLSYLRMAAVLLLVFSITWLLLSPKREANIELYSQTTETTPKIIVLPDGSQITLAPNSSLEYPARFEGVERKVTLSGEARFEIQKKRQAFIVQTPQLTVKVVGTTFNVIAFPDQNLQKVEVIEGKVAVMYQDTQLELTQNQVATLDLTQKAIKKTISPQSPNVLQFEATPLAEVIAQLNQVYQSNLQLARPELGQCLITVSFTGEESLENILEILAETLNLNIQKEANQITIDGKGC